MMRTANPALNTNVFSQARGSGIGGTMTLQGTVNKSFVLLGLLVLSATWVWGKAMQPAMLEGGLSGAPQAAPAAVGGFMMSAFSGD